MQIADTLARDRRVERIVLGVTHSRQLTPDLQDLVQICYLAILETDEDKVQDLWNTNAMDFYICRIILNQYKSRHSPFRDTITKFRSLSEELRDFRHAYEGDSEGL